jgi:hypothetical protein
LKKLDIHLVQVLMSGAVSMFFAMITVVNPVCCYLPDRGPDSRWYSVVAFTAAIRALAPPRTAWAGSR